MAISYSKLFVGISLPALCTGLASLLLSISANAQTIRPTTQKELKVFDPTTGNSGNIGIRAAAGTLSYTLTLPAAAPSANQVLTANAVTGGNVTLTWATPVSGTVTSVGLSVPTGFSVSSSPVTSAGTLSLSYASGYALPTTVSQTNWDGAYNDRITAASVTGTTTKTITLTQQGGGTVTATFSDLNTDAVSSVFGRTGAITSTTGDYTTAQITEVGNLYFNNQRARDAISLQTTGISGAATYSSTTGVLTIPDYTLEGLGGVGGSGTVNYLSKFASAGTLTNSLLFDNGTNVGIGTITPTSKLDVRSVFGDPPTSGTTTNAIFSITSSSAFPSLFFGLHSSASGVYYSPWIQAADRHNLGNFRNLFLNPNGGNVAIGTGTLTPTARLEIRGAGTTSATTALEVDNNSGNPLLVVKNDGSVGIGTTSPRSPLEIQEDNSSFFRMVRPPTPSRAITDYGFEGGNGGIGLYDYANSGYRWWVSPTGNVGINDTDPVGRFEVKARSIDTEVLEIEDESENTIFKVTRDGVIRAAKGYTGSGTRALHVSSTGTLTTTASDIRLKTNIEVIPNALQKVMGLRGVTYNWKDGRDTTRVLGMIAQEMLKVAPELVFQNNNGYYGIHYAETTGLLVEAIKEQQKIIDQLKTEQAATGVLIRQLQLDLQAIRKLNTAPKD